MQKIQGTKLVILNAGTSYVRMFLCAGLTLFSSRWVLAALGQTDFGLYAVVGGIMAFFGFITGSMSGSALRHFAYAIGQGNIDEVNKWFNASLFIHVSLALFLVIISVPFGRVMIDSVLVIPAERIDACHKVFLLTLLTVIVSVIAVPFTGMYAAKQRIFELSIYDVFRAIFVFGFAFFLVRIDSDRLVAYAAAIATITICIIITQVMRGMLCFAECKVRFEFSKKYIKELISFGGWSLFGSLGIVSSNQLMAFVLNICFGPKVNASFGIANQVSGQADAIAQGVSNALAPEVMSSEGRGDRERMIRMSFFMSKISVLMLSFALIPLVLELDTILSLWLVSVPEYAGALCRIVLISFLIDKLSSGCSLAVHANGNIAGYHVSLGFISISAPLIAWLIYSRGGGVVWSVGVALLITKIVCCFGRAWWVQRLMNVSVLRWFKDVVLRSAICLILSLLLASALAIFLAPTILRVLGTFLISSITLCASLWLFGLNVTEKRFVLDNIKKQMAVLKLKKGRS